MTERLTVSVEEAAELLGIGRTLAWSLVAQHRLPVLRLGKSVRVPLPALERWSVETALAGLEEEDGQPPELRLTVREASASGRRNAG